jgi:hypothetical protein
MASPVDKSSVEPGARLIDFDEQTCKSIPADPEVAYLGIFELMRESRILISIFFFTLIFMIPCIESSR